MSKYIIAADLGQASDYTAIVGVERIPRLTGNKREAWDTGNGVLEDEYEDCFHCGLIERPPLGTPYTAIVARLAKIVRSPKFRDDVELVVDYTGVGRPVVDMLRASGVSVLPVTITGGEEEREVDDAWRVPKVNLVTRMAAFAESGRLTYVRSLELGDVLRAELASFSCKITKSANATFGAEGWREGAHDDLVLAMALACWWGNRTPSQSWWPSNRQPAHGTPEYYRLLEEKLVKQHFQKVAEEKDYWAED